MLEGRIVLRLVFGQLKQQPCEVVKCRWFIRDDESDFSVLIFMLPMFMADRALQISRTSLIAPLSGESNDADGFVTGHTSVSCSFLNLSHCTDTADSVQLVGC